VPLGSSRSEDYNNRLNSVMSSTPLALDKMVDFLVKEDEYWCRTYNDSRLFSERKRDTAAVSKRNFAKHRRVADYLKPTTSGNGKEDTIIFDLTKKESCNLDSDGALSDDDNDDITDLISWISPYDSTSTIMTTNPRKPAPYILTKQVLHKTDNNDDQQFNRKRPCSSCGRPKLVNKGYSLQVCKQYCILSTAACKLTHHKNVKVTASKPYEQTLLTKSSLGTRIFSSSTVEMEIKSAIGNKRSVYISYIGGIGGDQP
jgi:hypothetical protein